MWLLESNLGGKLRDSRRTPVPPFQNRLGITFRSDLQDMPVTESATRSGRLARRSRTMQFEHRSSRVIAGHRSVRKSAAGRVPGNLTAGGGDIRGLAPISASGSFAGRWMWQFDLAGDLGLAGGARRRGKSCFRTSGAVVEIAAVLKGRESAKRPNTRRSQGRPGEQLAWCTSTGKRPRSAIHGSETDTIVTDGLVQAGRFDQVPGSGPLLRRMKPRHKGLLNGCGGQPGGSREPSGKSCSPDDHRNWA